MNGATRLLAAAPCRLPRRSPWSPAQRSRRCSPGDALASAARAVNIAGQYTTAAHARRSAGWRHELHWPRKPSPADCSPWHQPRTFFVSPSGRDVEDSSVFALRLTSTGHGSRRSQLCAGRRPLDLRRVDRSDRRVVRSIRQDGSFDQSDIRTSRACACMPWSRSIRQIGRSIRQTGCSIRDTMGYFLW